MYVHEVLIRLTPTPQLYNILLLNSFFLSHTLSLPLSRFLLHCLFHFLTHVHAYTHTCSTLMLMLFVNVDYNVHLCPSQWYISLYIHANINMYISLLHIMSIYPFMFGIVPWCRRNWRNQPKQKSIWANEFENGFFPHTNRCFVIISHLEGARQQRRSLLWMFYASHLAWWLIVRLRCVQLEISHGMKVLQCGWQSDMNISYRANKEHDYSFFPDCIYRYVYIF